MSESDKPPRMVVCVGAVVLQGKKALFIRQAYGRLKGQWSIPWGFVHDDAGLAQAPDEAAVRETFEEAGVTAEIVGLLGIQIRQRTAEAQLYTLFLCRHQGGQPTPDDHETDAAAYLSLEEMEALTQPIEPFCDWLVRRVLQGKHQLVRPVSDGPYQPDLAYL